MLARENAEILDRTFAVEYLYSTNREANAMLPYLIAGGVLALVVVIALALRGGSTPSVLMFQQVRDAILSLQAIAATQVTTANEVGKFQGMSQTEMERQTQRVQDTIRFVYTIEKDNGHFIHTVSSQMIARKPEKYQIQCMLVVMLTLNQQLETAGIDPKAVQFEVSRPNTGIRYVSIELGEPTKQGQAETAKLEMGTHYVTMVLSPEQNSKVLAIPKVT